MSDEFAHITEESIRKRVGSAALAEGYRYMYSQALSGLELQGNILKGNCKGRADKVYRVQVELSENEILDAGCTCPQGMNGRCRHVAALVLTWLNRGENFQRGQTIAEILNRLSRKELEETLETLVQRRPELKTIVEKMAPQAVWAQKSLSENDFRCVVEALLINNTDNSLWDAINSQKLVGEDLIRQREWSKAALLFVCLYQAIRQRYPQGDSITADEICTDCVEDLMRIPMNVVDEKEIRKIGEVMFLELGESIETQGTLQKDIVSWMAAGSAKQVQLWAAQAWDSLHRCSRKAQRRLWGMICLVFYGSKLDSNTQKKLYKEIGWYAELTLQLAREQNFDEIEGALAAADDYEMLAAVERLLKMNYPKQAFDVLEKRIKERPSDVLEDWLKKHRILRQSDEEAIELAQRMFVLRPDKESYQRLRSESLHAGVWDELQDRCLLQLKQSGQYQLLMEIFLDEWDLERAVFLWQDEPDKFPRAQIIQLAQVAETSQPVTSIKIYQELLESQLIALVEANILNASEAGENVRREIELLVSRLKELMTQAYGSNAWPEYVKSLRNRDLNL